MIIKYLMYNSLAYLILRYLYIVNNIIDDTLIHKTSVTLTTN